MSRPGGQLERSLAELTIGVAQGQARRQLALDDSATGEYEQQVRLPFSGHAASGWGFSELTVRFELPFLYAPLQRRVPFETPHYRKGLEIIESKGHPLLLDVVVIGWETSDEGWCTGARVRLAVCAPGQVPPDLVPYKAVAHLSFQGYATYAEGDEFQS